MEEPEGPQPLVYGKKSVVWIVGERQTCKPVHNLRDSSCSDILLGAVERRYRLVCEIGKSLAKPHSTGAI
ncbi:hypothetical protein SAMN05518849_12620 [Sphingobium sp. AP50]|nr:hypothetical protein SAMN05518849_12620 [Sphingobium sp. AP50]